jgi:hypothetical protein
MLLSLQLQVRLACLMSADAVVRMHTVCLLHLEEFMYLELRVCWHKFIAWKAEIADVGTSNGEQNIFLEN